MNIAIADLPAINASLNFIATILLAAGFVAIKMERKELHRNLMIGAVIFSAIFLGCYLVYHYHAGSKKFPDLGWIKTVYLLILIPHIILAAVMVPMILKTLWHAWRQQWQSHRKIARITFPIWMYVSVTGVIIYLMLYQWYPAP